VPGKRREELLEVCGLYEQARDLQSASGHKIAALSAKSRSAAVVAIASRKMAERIGARLQIQELADEIGIDKFYLIRMFRRYTGKTPYEYFLGLRLDLAKSLLECNCSVSAVAFDCGFADQSHLTRLFKREVGITPRAYQLRCASHGTATEIPPPIEVTRAA
jgi:transcriptional regulator GlxA family with amidase domain